MKWKRSSALSLVLFALAAGATPKRFALTTDAATNGEGEVELEGWLDFGRPATPRHEGGQTNGMAWLGARVGLLDSLELASFLVLEKKNEVNLPPSAQLEADGSFTQPRYPPNAAQLEAGQPGDLILADDQSGLMMWVTELRWRPIEVGKWPVDLFGSFQVTNWFEKYHPVQFRFTLGASKSIGRFLIAANVSWWDSVAFTTAGGKSARWQWLELELAVSVNLLESDGSLPAVSLGLEQWGFVPVKPGDHVHNHLLHGGGMVVGPTVALARGRLWLTGHFGVPVVTRHVLHNPDGTTRMVFDPAAMKLVPEISYGPTRPFVGRITLGINL